MDRDYCIVYKKRKKRKRKATVLAVLFFLLLGILLHYFLYMVPLIKKVSDERVRAFATSAVGKAAMEIVGLYSYRDFVEVIKDNDGNIALVQANAPLIHAVTRSVAAKASESISTMNELLIEIPLGNLFGIALLAGRGPALTVKAIPVGIIGTQINSEFISAGINQTLHRIEIRISVEVNVILPGADSKISTGVPIPVAESVIVGRIPDFYFSSALLDQLGN